MDLFEREETRMLVRAFLTLKTQEECRAFLEDLLTTREILDLSQRLMVASLLDRQLVYSEIARQTGASSATISRVNRCCVYGAGGYATVLPRLETFSEADEEA